VAFFRRSDTTSGLALFKQVYHTAASAGTLQLFEILSDTSFRLTPSLGFLEEQKRDFLLD